MKNQYRLQKYFVSVFALAFSLALRAQMPQRAFLSWDEFLVEYSDYLETEENADDDNLWEEEVDRLEQMASRPLQLNRASREELLELPFLSGAQVDSLLSYRSAKHGFLALGELQLVRGMDYFPRRWLTLFVRCDSALVEERAWSRPRTLKERLNAGTHEVATLAEVPFYQREGYKTPETPTANNYFTGNSLRHLIRYRFAQKKELMWGVTFEKDAGEPIGKRGFYPYDYISGYVYAKPKGRNWSIVLGDYEVRKGRGLLFGRAVFGGAQQFYTAQRYAGLTFRPHTSVAESGFFRGAAAQWIVNGFTLSAFASARKLDGRMENDTVRTILTTGLHRTVNEVLRRRNVLCLTGGLGVEWQKKWFACGVSAYAAHYNHTVWPEERFYNKYYFRGTYAGGMSGTYSYKRKLFSVQGEVAFDKDGHFATEHVVGLSRYGKWTANLQVRHYDARYVSVYGNALQQASRVSNEEGVLLGGTYRFSRQTELAASIDAFQFMKPTYTTVLPHAKGVELNVRGSHALKSGTLLQLRYKMKTRQRTVTGYQLLEYRTVQRLVAMASFVKGNVDCNVTLAGTSSARQTGRHDWGGLGAARISWQCSKTIRLRTLAALFFTSDYASAVYLQEPQLLQSVRAQAFFNHGAHATVAADFKLCKWLEWGIRLSSTRYFNVDEQSAGVMAISSPWKNDAGVLLRVRF